jgi:hypothetical protein
MDLVIRRSKALWKCSTAPDVDEKDNRRVLRAECPITRVTVFAE